MLAIQNYQFFMFRIKKSDVVKDIQFMVFVHYSTNMNTPMPIFVILILWTIGSHPFGLRGPLLHRDGPPRTP